MIFRVHRDSIDIYRKRATIAIGSRFFLLERDSTRDIVGSIPYAYFKNYVVSFIDLFDDSNRAEIRIQLETDIPPGWQNAPLVRRPRGAPPINWQLEDRRLDSLAELIACEVRTGRFHFAAGMEPMHIAVPSDSLEIVWNRLTSCRFLQQNLGIIEPYFVQTRSTEMKRPKGYIGPASVREYGVTIVRTTGLEDETGITVIPLVPVMRYYLTTEVDDTPPLRVQAFEMLGSIIDCIR